MKNINAILVTDGYKTSHHLMYPENTTTVYSNYTCRGLKYMPQGAKDIVVMGSQKVTRELNILWKENFFAKDKTEVIAHAKGYLDNYLSTDYDMSHFEALHDLGYLPVLVKSLPEGSIIGEKIPLLTIVNTHPDFFWLVNFLETYISTSIWKIVHSASMAYGYKKVLTKWALATDKDNLSGVDFQAHDFSFRGMQGLDGAISSALGFMACFKGTDTLPALQAADELYDEPSAAFSVPASEHAVMTAYGKENEIDGFVRLMKQFPTGILSIVSDSFDLWQVLTKFLPALKDQILGRDGKLVIRPDSGDPVDIICGVLSQVGRKYDTTISDYSIYELKGVIELLWETFGGTVNSKGYKVLDSHIGAIYGDSITIERAEEICSRLEAKGFASSNIVLGVGSFSMGFATRDNQGGAVKATYCVVDGQPRNIFKDPITDDGTKKSAKGLLHVTEDFKLIDECSVEMEKTGMLKTIFMNGNEFNTVSLGEIRDRISSTL